MQTENIKVWLIGASLCVAPIFYSALYSSAALAQSASNQGSSSVLELQQLRSEIAELRDQLERQQYQIRQLQRAVKEVSVRPAPEPDSGPETSALPLPGASSVDSAGPGTIYDTRSGETQPEILPSPSAASQAADINPAGTGNGAVNNEFVTQLPSTVPQTQASPVPSAPDLTGSQATLPSPEDDFYRPYPQDENVPVVNENPEVVSAARQSRQANNTYPPVIDRSIGSPAGSPAPAVSQGPGSQSAPIPSAVEPVAEPNLAVPPAVSAGPGSAVGNPSVIDGGGAMQVPATANRGVIQVPTRPTQVPQSNSTVVTPTVPIAPIVSEEDYYQQGFDLLKQSRYVQAVDVFKEQIARYPNGGFADDAHYWVAESMYLNRSLAESKQYFRAIIDNFQQSPRLPDAMLKTAYIEQEQGNEIEARILLQEIIQYHPRSDAAISAKNRLEKLD